MESDTLEVMGNKMDVCLLGPTTCGAFGVCCVIWYVLYSLLRENVVTTTVIVSPSYLKMNAFDILVIFCRRSYPERLIQ